MAFLAAGELFGGVERHLLGMCTWMRRQGRKPVLMLFHDGELAAQARALGICPVLIPGQGSFDLKSPGWIAGFLQDNGINLVHAHGYRAVVNAALAKRKYPFSLVRTVHGRPEGRSIFGPGALKSRVYVKAEQWAAHQARAHVCYVTEDLRRTYALVDRGLSASTVYNGIDSLEAVDFARPVDLETGIFHFGIVGRVSEVKGIQFALQALARMDGEPALAVNIIGTGPLQGYLKNKTRELGIEEKVRFLGFKDNIYDYLAHLDALLMPSLHEGLPFTILEALSLGTPIIASRTGGLAEILSHEETALLVDVGDVETLSLEMIRMSNVMGLRNHLAEMGREQQRKKFSLENMGQMYWQIYNEVLNDG